MVRDHLLGEIVKATQIVHPGDEFTWENHVKCLWTFQRLACGLEIEYIFYGISEGTKTKVCGNQSTDFRSI